MIANRLEELFSSPWKKTLYIMFFAQLMTAVGFSSIFPFLPLYVQDLGASTDLSIELLSGLVFSSQAFTMMLASPFWGAMADRLGRKLMVERSLFGGAVLLLLMAFVQNAEQLVLLRTIQGLVTGTVAAGNALVASQAPRERAGYAMGLLQVSMGAGVALGPLIGGVIADNIGYSAAFYVTAAMLLLAGILVLFGIQENFVRPTIQSQKIAPRQNFLAGWKGILSARGVSMAYTLRFLSQLGTNTLAPIAPLFVGMLMTDQSSVNTTTGMVVGIGSATTTMSAMYLGRLGDRIGHRRIILFCLPLAAALYILQSQVTQAWQLILLQALVGAAIGGVVPAISALLARFTRPGVEGAVFGLDNSITSGARALAPLVGSGIAVWINLRATFVATGVIFLLTWVLASRYLPKEETLAETG
jgi:DHA1 family multidrug resistance protein-like MFS transporter